MDLPAIEAVTEGCSKAAAVQIERGAFRRPLCCWVRLHPRPAIVRKPFRRNGLRCNPKAPTEYFRNFFPVFVNNEEVKARRNSLGVPATLTAIIEDVPAIRSPIFLKGNAMRKVDLVGVRAVRERVCGIRTGLSRSGVPCWALVCWALGCLLAVSLGGVPAFGEELKFTSADESRAEFERTVKPFLARHCVECHSGKNTEGDLDVTKLDPDMKA
ncbi:MAG: hypothetical protein LW698_08675, partial [Planctomycetaceae bacterium]|nr:hypothetical protein [Planctomycetaceae bacterium]